MPTIGELRVFGRRDPEFLRKVSMLEKAMSDRKKLHEQQKELDRVREPLDALVKGLMGELELSSFQHDSVGSFSFTNYKTQTIDKQKLTVALLQAGLSAERVNEVIEASTKVNESKRLRFTPIKEV